MKYARFGNSELNISRICMGLGQILILSQNWTGFLFKQQAEANMGFILPAPDV